MLQVFSVRKSEIHISKRLDAEYLLGEKNYDARHKAGNESFVPLGDLCEFIRTGPAGSLLPSSRYMASGIPLLRPSNLDMLTCDAGERVYVAETTLTAQRLSVYRNEDILFARVGDVKFGMVYGFETDVLISPNLIGMRVNSKVLDPYFLLAFLQTDEAQQQLLQGTKRASLSSLAIGEITRLLVPQVPMETQKSIGKLMRQALDQKLEAKQLLKHADRLLMEAVAGGPEKNTMVTSAKVRLSAVRKKARLDAEYFEDKRQLCESTDRGMSATKRLGEIARLVRGVEVGSNEYQENGTLFLRVGNISEYGLLPKSQKYISEKLFIKLRNKYQPQIGEILLVKDGKPGVGCVVQDSIEGIVSEGIVRVQVKELNVFYVSACIRSSFCQEQILRDTDGSLVAHLKVRQIEQLLIPIVSYVLQAEIIEKMSLAYFLFAQAVSVLSLASVAVQDLTKEMLFVPTGFPRPRE